MADNFNWGKSMTSDEVRNAAENLWRVENYRNRMPDRSLENTRVRMAEAEARYNAKQQNDRITMLESHLKSANDAINRLSETQKTDSTPKTTNDDPVETVKYYKKEIQNLKSNYEQVLANVDKVKREGKRNCNEKIAKNLTTFIDNNFMNWDYTAIRRSYNTIHAISEKYGFDVSFEKYLSTRSNTITCDIINENISNSDIKIIYTYIGSYLRQYMGNYFDIHYEELGIYDGEAFEDYLVNTFPCINIEDVPIHDMITIIFTQINNKYEDIEIAKDKRDTFIRYYKEELDTTEGALLEQLRYNSDIAMSDRIKSETDARYEVFRKEVIEDYKKNNLKPYKINKTVSEGTNNTLLTNTISMAVLIFFVWIVCKFVSSVF